LVEDDWTNHYDLSIQLHSACAETYRYMYMYYVPGNHDGLTIVSKSVLGDTPEACMICFVCTTPAVSSLASDGRLLDAIKFGRGVLDQLARGALFRSDIYLMYLTKVS
jgi:hypothetical protein